MRQLLPRGSEARVTVMVCGPPEMIDGVASVCLGDREQGGLALQPTQVLFEKWW